MPYEITKYLMNCRLTQGFSIPKHMLVPTDKELANAITMTCHCKSNKLTKLAVAQWLYQICFQMVTPKKKVNTDASTEHTKKPLSTHTAQSGTN